jgi:predicted DNA-binding transcriptional regulator AlpA
MLDKREGVPRLVDRRGLRTEFGYTLSRTEIDRREKKGEFPQRLKLGDFPNSRVFYVYDEVAAHIAAEIAKRDAQVPQDEDDE